ncbi:MAG: hypothetical protein Q9174_003944 [Haloplaca sp. 1 TL-2023]
MGRSKGKKVEEAPEWGDAFDRAPYTVSAYTHSTLGVCSPTYLQLPRGDLSPKRMEKKHIFVVTHSRTCSTALERVFMNRRDILEIFHEPFGDAFYFGPEKISPLHLQWGPTKIERSGRGHVTYNNVLQEMFDAAKQGDKRIFSKDISYHIVPPIHSQDAQPASLREHFKPTDAPNPTVLPTSIVEQFQFVFLIRNPSSSIPSLYRCFIPPLSDMTEDHELDPEELGYRELRILIDHLYPPESRSKPVPHAGETKGNAPSDGPLVIDADDFLVSPDAMVQLLCSRLSIPYSPSMLTWDKPEDHAFAHSLFAKFAGYHEDALHSTGMKPRSRAPEKSRQEYDEEWTSKYGDEAAKMLRSAVDQCQEDYEYLRQFKVQP